MFSNNSFSPTGQTMALAATTTSTAAPLQAPASIGQPLSGTFLVSNASSQGCFLIAATSAAQAVSVAPVAGTPSASIWLPGNTTQVLTFGGSSYFAVLTPTGTSTVYITPGVCV